jgi:exonuclease III
MNILSWNCRGLGNFQTVHALRGLVNRNDPKIVFLMETKINSLRMEGVRRTIGFENGLSIPSEGKSGGLALLWRQGYEVVINSYSKYHIDSVVKVKTTDDIWRVTGFYGHPETSQKETTWRLLESLNNQSNVPWVCVGDFNEILENREKTGRAIRPQAQMNRFREVINHCYFRAIKFEGPRFTWCNNRLDGGRVLARLDRGFSNMEWSLLFPNAVVQHLIESSSDHCALLLCPDGMRKRKTPYRFHFEAMWMRSDDCRNIIKQAWHPPDVEETTLTLSDRISSCATHLTQWNKSVFGNVTRQMAHQKRQLQNLMQEEDSGGTRMAKR